MGNNQEFKNIIIKYKSLIQQSHLKDELYKWKHLKNFKGRPDTNAIDFTKEYKDIDYGNLMYHLSKAVGNNLGRNKPEEFRKLFQYLFDESKSLKDRIEFFNSESLKLYRSIGEEKGHHQDERAIATYLTFNNPEKYTFYKSSFYLNFCRAIGVEPAGRNEKYIHYLELVNQFIKDYIIPDTELIETVKSFIPEYYDGTNHLLLAQDILYTVFNTIEEDTKYWLFQSNLSIYNVVGAIKDGALKSWSVKTHKNEISVGDKIILWVSGKNSGCYALAEVTSEVFESNDNEEEIKYSLKPNALEITSRVSIKITHDLVDNPILKEQIQGIKELSFLKAGNQGTNFKATKIEYNTFLKLAEKQIQKTKYWLYAPGENASKWEEFYVKGIMGLGWDEIGDLKQYKNKEEIKTALIQAYGGESSKSNDVSANYDFLNKVSIGDIIIVKKGRGELLGYGIVTSDYLYDIRRLDFQKFRNVDWKLKGFWNVDFSLVLKTLTDITMYESDHPDYNMYYERLLGIMGVGNLQKNLKEEFKNWLIQKYGLNSGTTSSYLKSIEILSSILNKDIFTIFESEFLISLYEDLLKEQKNIEGKYYHSDAHSYGGNGFYSASIKSYIEFLTSLKTNMSTIINSKNSSKNIILYGPPGTGKTYTLKSKFFPQYITSETSITKEIHFENVIRECSWWQVIAVALIQLGKSKVSSIAEHPWVVQKTKLSNSNTVRPILWSQLQSHTIDSCEFVNVKVKQQPYIFNKTEDSFWNIIEEEVKEQVPELFDLIDSVENFTPNNSKEIKRYVFTTFHQSYSYEDFIEGIKPILNEGEIDGNVSYHIEDGVFKQLCKKAEMDPENRYAIFIDEINRGNVSSIFGELITLIEQDKRKGASNEMSVILPYSKKQFSVPNNVDIYGTMNTADRSVEALDTALRRRFSFTEMLPEPELIALEGKSKDNKGKVGEIDLVELLQTINERIEVLVDRDHTIGHAYFMEVHDESSLKGAFKNKIIPLLQEYFFGNYEKMELVIGPEFFDTSNAKNVSFAINNHEYNDLPKRYKIIDIDNVGFNIQNAITKLLNKKS